MSKNNPRKSLPPAKGFLDFGNVHENNELHYSILSLLKAIIAFVWADHMDWFFGVDLAIYQHYNQPPIIPDAFLSLGVERIVEEDLRLSYDLCEEKRVPIMTLEVIFDELRDEFSTKKEFYTQLEVLYYAIYNPQRQRTATLTVYRLVNGKYQLQRGNPVWLPEIGLGIGSERGTYQGITREWLYWYNEQGKRLLTPEERVQQAEQRAQILAERLKSLGVDPDSLV
ncbi:Uma2 family endonuclease [Nostoc sp. CENA67]|uniref:Uma2 family endonuclease n=1 Tax=Amazonocrinis nigriterrae CENA67 TaxID=2794033 RepID=A0A8J7L9P0_9NOST|nr:Uma2 family endonuclease [Amazonocrinis nigriterrae]MBH8563176.1 Uma2 family endonuclease [Amazonocrinis nigriterrae CENA67]